MTAAEAAIVLLGRVTHGCVSTLCWAVLGFSVNGFRRVGAFLVRGGSRVRARAWCKGYLLARFLGTTIRCRVGSDERASWMNLIRDAT